MENQNRDFKGVWIPKEIYLDKNLNWTDKILLIEIDSLDVGDKHCFASNEYFSQFLGVSIRAISTSINKLKSLGYIEEVDFDGRKRTLKSNIHPDMKQTSMESRRKLPVTIEENFQHNNIYNNTSNNIDDNSNISCFSDQKKESIVTKESIKESSRDDIEEIKRSDKTKYEDFKKNEIMNIEAIKNTYYKWKDEQGYTFDIEKFISYYKDGIKKCNLYFTFSEWKKKQKANDDNTDKTIKQMESMLNGTHNYGILINKED